MPSSLTWPSFLVSSYWACWEVTPTASKKVHTGEGLYYGVTWDEDNIYVGYRGLERDGVPEIAVLDKDYQVKGKLPGVYTGLHQILYSGGNVYATITAEDSVDVVDESGTRTRKNWTGFQKDMHHINSIHRDGDDFWVCYHNLSKTLGEGKPSRAVRLDSTLSTVKEFVEIGHCIHNVFVDDTYIYVCDSDDGALVRLNRESNEVVSLPLGPWTRGLAVSDDFIFVGSSRKGDRQERMYGDLYIHAIDRKTLTLVDERVFKDFGAIFSLRIIDRPDHAHNGIPFPRRSAQ